MTQALQSWSNTQRTMKVYSRRAADTTNFPSGLPTTFTSGSWQEDGQLVPINGSWRLDRPHVCTLAWRPGGSSGGAADPSVELAHARYAMDDQVKVVAIIAEDANAEHVLFEGTIQRINTDLKHEGADGFGMPRETEGVFVTVFDDAWRDNVTEKHVITGRWWIPAGLGANAAPLIVRALSMPATFNLGGRPNMSASGDTFNPKGSRLADQRAFATDDDPSAEFWTAARALGSILGHWLYGLDGAVNPGNGQADIDRFIDVETATASAIDAGSADAKFAGLDQVLGELDVTGLGVIDAARKVCRAVGLQLIAKPLPGALGSYDTRYTLAVRRRHTGEQVALNLGVRGGYDDVADAATFHASNDFNQLSVMTDGEGIRNVISVTGESYIEARFDLFPMWTDAEEATDALTTADQGELPDDPGDETTYQKRHVVGGAQYLTYAHVGRRWGLQCQLWEPHKTSPADYDVTNDSFWSTALGFDFVGYLGLNSAGAYKTAQTAAGVGEDVDWTNRLRRLLPMMSKQAAAAGVQYVLEVSEDGGATWTTLRDGELGWMTLRDRCGIWLDIENLAAVKLDYLRTGRAENEPALADNWWALIRDGNANLRFAVTAVIRADNGLRGEADRQSTSGVATRRHLVAHLPIEEVWIREDAAISGAGAGGGWTRQVGGDAAPGSTDSVQNVALVYAQRVQDALDDLVTSGLVHMDWLELDRFDLGVDVIPQIVGRNLSFEAGDSSSRYPTIVGIDFAFMASNAGGQSLRVVLDDHRMLEGGKVA